MFHYPFWYPWTIFHFEEHPITTGFCSIEICVFIVISFPGCCLGSMTRSDHLQSNLPSILKDHFILGIQATKVITLFDEFRNQTNQMDTALQWHFWYTCTPFFQTQKSTWCHHPILVGVHNICKWSLPMQHILFFALIRYVPEVSMRWAYLKINKIQHHRQFHCVHCVIILYM